MKLDDIIRLRELERKGIVRETRQRTDGPSIEGKWRFEVILPEMLPADFRLEWQKTGEIWW